MVGYLNNFEFEISYMNGKENIVVDALSRRIHVNYTSTISLYGIEFQEHIFMQGSMMTCTRSLSK